MRYCLIILVQGFCSLEIKITQFPDGFRLKRLRLTLIQELMLNISLTFYFLNIARVQFLTIQKILKPFKRNFSLSKNKQLKIEKYKNK